MTTTEAQKRALIFQTMTPDQMNLFFWLADKYESTRHYADESWGNFLREILKIDLEKENSKEETK